MVKPRLCFALLHAHEKFYLSRNFNLQEVGNFEWIIENYDFDLVSRSIDELLILNVEEKGGNWECFLQAVQKIAKFCFMPVAVGGGVSTIMHAQSLFDNGADKIIINSSLFENPTLVTNLVDKYGSQSIVGSLDFKRSDAGIAEIYIRGGQINTEIPLSDGVNLVEKLGIGELYLNSIDRDGTGMGYDLLALKEAYNSCDIPVIAAGGADTPDRLVEGIVSGYASAVSTGHLFNFMCDGLSNARDEIIKSGCSMSRWDFQGLKAKK
jgi:cyclase